LTFNSQREGEREVKRVKEMMRRGGKLILALALLASSSACTRFENAMASIPVFSFLRNAPSFDPYEAPRPAPYGSVPFNTPAGESLGPLEASEAGLNEFAARITNPLAADDTAALRVGETMFLRHCSVCHNADGKGNGPIVGPGKFPMGPNLTLPITVGRADGYIYGVIRAGRGLMPSYGPRMTHLERWATVNYVRQLQRGAGGQPQPAAAPAAAPAPTATTAQ
jgi:mono/diheme cytochrome c family protein